MAPSRWAATRAAALDPQTRSRLARSIDRAARPIHAERVRAWVAGGTGSFPRFEEARRIASDELALMCEALGDLAFIEPSGFDDALVALHGRPWEDDLTTWG